jgi:hypothetical protein
MSSPGPASAAPRSQRRGGSRGLECDVAAARACVAEGLAGAVPVRYRTCLTSQEKGGTISGTSGVLPARPAGGRGGAQPGEFQAMPLCAARIAGRGLCCLVW